MASSSAVAASPIEATIIRKIRTRIVPLILVLWVIAKLDQINIGFAALTMNRELAITSQQYGFIAGVFFFGYFLFEIPSNLLLHRIGARVWISRILISWGTLAVLTGFAQTAHQLYVARFLLGMAEAGYFPGLVLYLTYWFPQRHLARTIALLLTGNALSNIVGAPLSGLILDYVHWFGVGSWRWLLILEGLPAILGGVVIYLLLPGRPADASFLTTGEKDWIKAELALEEHQKLSARKMTAGEALTNGRVWHLTAAYFTAMIGNYVLGFWMPQLLKAFSSEYLNTTVGLLVMLPYLAALPVMILVARASDRRLERRYHAAIPLVIGGISLVLLATTDSRSIVFSMALWCLAASGVYSLWGPFWSLPNEFLTGFSAAAGIALINSFGNLGGFVGPYAMGAINQRTGSFRGGILFVGISLFTSAALILALRKRPEQQGFARI